MSRYRAEIRKSPDHNWKIAFEHFALQPASVKLLALIREQGCGEGRIFDTEPVWKVRR